LLVVVFFFYNFYWVTLHRPEPFWSATTFLTTAVYDFQSD